MRNEHRKQDDTLNDDRDEPENSRTQGAFSLDGLIHVFVPEQHHSFKKSFLLHDQYPFIFWILLHIFDILSIYIKLSFPCFKKVHIPCVCLEKVICKKIILKFLYIFSGGKTNTLKF